MIRTNHVLAPLVALLLFSSCTSARLVNPPRASFPQKDMGRVESGILTAMQTRGWVPVKERDGSILATLHLRTHTAVARITYGTDWYQIDYVSSDDLGYRKDAGGQEWIHRNYNGWIENLAKDIDTVLASS